MNSVNKTSKLLILRQYGVKAFTAFSSYMISSESFPQPAITAYRNNSVVLGELAQWPVKQGGCWDGFKGVHDKKEVNYPFMPHTPQSAMLNGGIFNVSL